MFLVGAVKDDYLLVIIFGIISIIIGLVIYYFITNRKKADETPRPVVNFEAKPELFQQLEEMIQEPAMEVKPQLAEETLDIKMDSPIEKMELEDQKTSTNIASLLEEMQHDLDNPEIDVEKYEADQEENAIISYKELMRFKAEREKNVVLEDKPVDEIKEVLVAPEEAPIDQTATEEIKKFKRSEFISPIFGFNESSNVTYREIKRPTKKEELKSNYSNEWESEKMLDKLENDAPKVIEVDNVSNQEELDSETSKRNDNFLEALVDFRSKLD